MEDLKQRQTLLGEDGELKGKMACSKWELSGLSIFSFIMGALLVVAVFHFTELGAGPDMAYDVNGASSSALDALKFSMAEAALGSPAQRASKQAVHEIRQSMVEAALGVGSPVKEASNSALRKLQISAALSSESAVGESKFAFGSPVQLASNLALMKLQEAATSLSIESAVGAEYNYTDITTNFGYNSFVLVITYFNYDNNTVAGESTAILEGLTAVFNISDTELALISREYVPISTEDLWAVMPSASQKAEVYGIATDPDFNNNLFKSISEAEAWGNSFTLDVATSTIDSDGTTTNNECGGDQFSIDNGLADCDSVSTLFCSMFLLLFVTFGL